jgi:hypothetical protein
MATKMRREHVLAISFLGLGLLTLTGIHCSKSSNDNGSDAGTPVCQENELRCDGDMVVLCRTGIWQNWENCANAGMVCVDDGAGTASCQPVDAGAPDAGTPDAGTPDGSAG